MMTKLGGASWGLRGCLLIAALALIPFTETRGHAKDPNYFIIPAVSTSKNDGVDVGVIVPFIYGDADGRINEIVAPMYVHNQFLGSRFTLNLFKYPARGQDITLITSFTERIERKFILSSRNLYLSGGQYSLEASGGFFKNATARFFGLGSQTPAANESNYTDRELYALVTGGLYIGPGTRVTITERLRNVEIQTGGLVGDTIGDTDNDRNLPSSRVVFPFVKGMNGATILGHKLGFLQDTRDDTVTPTIGSFFSMFAELAQSLTAEATTVFSRYGFEYRRLLPNETKQYTFAFRAKFDATVGGDAIPFFERSTLGGQNSLRGYGVGRFVDNDALLFNFEERIQLFHLRILGTVAEVETAPFLDVGKVTRTFRYRAFAQYEANPGIGFRAIARPNVVGRVDFAKSNDGNAVFAGLDFPF